MENKKGQKLSTVLIGVLLGGAIASLIITGKLSEIRAVVFVQILVCGVLLGILLTRIFSGEKKDHE